MIRLSEAARKKSLRANKLWYGHYGVKLACGITVVIRPDSLEHPNIKMPARQDGRQLLSKCPFCGGIKGPVVVYPCTVDEFSSFLKLFVYL